MSDFPELWREFYPDAEPTGWRMRAAGVRHWVRFHSLPDSKRYAESEAEYSIVLERQNTLANAVLGERQPCWLVQTCWVTPEDRFEISDESEMFRETHAFGLEHAFSFREDEGEDESTWDVMASRVLWTLGGFDEVLLRIADDRAAPTLWVSEHSGAVFAPYDGGVDLFLPSESKMQELRLAHADWLSSHPEGL